MVIPTANAASHVAAASSDGTPWVANRTGSSTSEQAAAAAKPSLPALLDSASNQPCLKASTPRTNMLTYWGRCEGVGRPSTGTYRPVGTTSRHRKVEAAS